MSNDRKEVMSKTSQCSELAVMRKREVIEPRNDTERKPILLFKKQAMVSVI